MKKSLVVLLLLSISFSACRKEPVTPDNPTVERNGLYILNEGLWNYNNSTISFYNLNSGEVTFDIFTAVNNRGLGDTGNDLQPYGSKLYCVVNTSENVQVMDFYTAKVVGTVSLQGKLPRRICFSGSKAYVSCFDGTVVRFDTASLAVEATVTVGPNPEGVCIVNGKLYVANTGGYNAPDYGTTVSVIDLNTFAVTKEIPVVLNPTRLYVSPNQQDIYLISSGDYGAYFDIKSCLQKISPVTDEVVQTYNFELNNLVFYDNSAYFYSYDINSKEYTIQIFDLATETIVNNHFITDGTVLKIPYGIAVNPQNGDVYISDAQNYTVNGDVYCFDQNGKKKFSFEVGVNPSAMVFLN
jgi:YVTN family beta-propeller protein